MDDKGTDMKVDGEKGVDSFTVEDLKHSAECIPSIAREGVFKLIACLEHNDMILPLIIQGIVFDEMAEMGPTRARELYTEWLAQQKDKRQVE